MTTHKNKLDGFYIGETVYTGPNSTHKVTIEKFMIVCNGNGRYTNFYPNIDAIDWLNKNKFDYRGLIPKGLAINATEQNG